MKENRFDNINKMNITIIKNIYTKNKILIFVRNKCDELEVIKNLTKIYEENNKKDLLNYYVIESNSNKVCHLRKKEFEENTTKDYKKNFAKISVITDKCKYCKEKFNCKIIKEKQTSKILEYNYELILINEVANRYLYDITFFDKYDKLFFYKTCKMDIVSKISKSEINDFILGSIPKKNNTNNKIMQLKYCKKALKLNNLFFQNFNDKIKQELIKTIMSIDTNDYIKKQYLVNKLRYFDFKNITSVLPTDYDIVIKYILKLEKL